MNEVIAGRDQMFLRELSRAIGGYMCSVTGGEVAGAVQDNVVLLPVLGGTLAPDLFFTLSQYGNYEVRVDLFHSTTVEQLLLSPLTMGRLPHIESWLKDKHFRALAFSTGRFGRALEYFVNVLRSLRDRLGETLSQTNIELIEDVVQRMSEGQHYQAGRILFLKNLLDKLFFQPTQLVRAYGGATPATFLVFASLAGIPIPAEFTLPGGKTIEVIQTEGYLWRDEANRPIPLSTLKSLLTTVCATPIIQSIRVYLEEERFILFPSYKSLFLYRLFPGHSLGKTLKKQSSISKRCAHTHFQ